MDERIYDAVRHAVLTQRLPAGSRLPEVNLGEIFGVGRSVVRKALMRLAADNIITMRRNQTARVIRPSQKETQDIFAARRVVEAEVMRVTAGHLDHAAGAELQAIVDAEQTAHDQQDHDNRIELSVDFHMRIADHCDNSILADMLRELILRTSVAVALYKRPGMDACYTDDDHRIIAKALVSGDGELAAKTAVAHLNHLEERLLLEDTEDTVDLASILRV
mgnify:FL=1